MSEPIEWFPELDDVMLNTVLGGETKALYMRALVKIANRFSIGKPERHEGPNECRDGDPVRRRLWGLATRCVEYTPTACRHRRDNLPWSHGELLVLKWAFVMDTPKQAKGKPVPDNEYIAMVLARSVDEVKEKRGITKPSKGFGLI